MTPNANTKLFGNENMDIPCPGIHFHTPHTLSQKVLITVSPFTVRIYKKVQCTTCFFETGYDNFNKRFWGIRSFQIVENKRNINLR